MKLKNEQQQSWLSLAFVWAGAMISVPGLIIGGTLVAGMPLWEALLTGFIGYGIIVILMILTRNSKFRLTRTFCQSRFSSVWHSRFAKDYFHYFSDCLLRLVWFASQCQRRRLHELFKNLRH